MDMENHALNFTPAERIASFKPYFFATLNEKLTELKAKGMDVIRLDMGSPDLPPADFIVDSYYRLFIKRRDEFGIAGQFMVFPSS